MKEKFLNDIFWSNTLSSSFQRANIYKPNIDDKQKMEFRSYMKSVIVSIAKEYINEVSPDRHLENIKRVGESSRKYESILRESTLNFGVSQKLLNLYLKFLWCWGKIPVPPHFPVDRVIQEKLGIKDIIAWTQMKGAEGEEDYMKVIGFANNRLKTDNGKYANLSELELNLYSE